MIRAFKYQLLIILSFLITGTGLSQSDVLRILPLGNSLTYGYYQAPAVPETSIGYRKKLYDLLNAAGYNFDLVGHQYTGYSLFPDAENGGILGIKDEELSQVMQYGYYLNDGWQHVDVVYPNQPYMNAYPADLVLLHIGTNDWINDEYNLYQVDDLLGLFDAIDDYETAYNTEVLVIICRVINARNSSGDCAGPLTDWRVTHYNDRIEEVVDQRIALGDKVKLIDMQCGAGINYKNDMLNLNHPNQTGYDKMGQHWFDEIDNIHNAPVIIPFSFVPAGQGESFPALDLDNYVSDDYTLDADIEWTLETDPVSYNVVIDGGNTLTVTPKDTEWTGSEDITFIATDKGRYIEKLKKSTSVTVTFTTIDINEKPVILSQITDFNLNEDTAFELSLEDLEIEDDNPPSDWTLHIKPGDHYSYIGYMIYPEEDYDEQLLVNVTVSDLEEESEVFQVVVNYNPVNDAPEITGGGPLTIQEDASRTITFSDLVYNDPDNSEGELTLYVLTGLNYTVEGTTITPVADYYGTLSVAVRLRDLDLYSNTYDLTINVSSVNDAPVITSIPETVTGDGDLYEYQIVAHDVDAGDVIEYSVPQKPEWLDLNTSTGLLSGTPSLDHVGMHPVIVAVSDGNLTTQQPFTLEVKHFNTPPEFTTLPDTTVQVDSSYYWKVQTFDEDGDEVLLIPMEIPYFLDFLSSNGYLIGIAHADNQGIHSVEIGASDGQDTTIYAFLLYVGSAIPVPEIFSAEEITKVYPNPARNTLNIEPLTDDLLQSIRIVNSMGGLMNEQRGSWNPDETITLNVSDLPEGTYLLQLFFEQRVAIQRFVVGR